ESKDTQSRKPEDLAANVSRGPQPKITEKSNPGGQNLNRILDIELPVTVHFSSIRKPLVDVLKLGPGSLLELDRLATDPVILKVNDRVFARGQVVDVDGYYGVKITEIVSAQERITSLGDY